MILLDLSHTSHTRARTGVQRVCRSLYPALTAGGDAAPITYDPNQRAWRPLAAWEMRTLESTAPAAKRGARWPLQARLGGTLRRITRTTTRLPPASSALVVPEIFSPAVAAALPALFAQVRGPRVALFHDAIALKLPEITPPKTVARFPAYLQELTRFDGIAAVSEASAVSLREYWDWLGLKKTPPIRALPLGLNPPPADSPATPSSDGRPVVLCVGTIEGRKNHQTLLSACAHLWDRGLEFELHLIGLAHAETGRAATAQITRLQQAGRPLRYDGAVDDATLEAAYAGCSFTVYPSIMEGFGLPVLESLQRGRPCICSADGALGEAALKGGCLTVKPDAPDQLAVAIEELLVRPETRFRLAAEARARRFRTWSDYAADLRTWLVDLSAATRR
jgi:glycosyltransferase involved in cell wall biosynthesis